jgi:hypothetical protein
MKRKDLIGHLLKAGRVLIREGAKHSVFLDVLTKRSSTVPRHNEIDNFLAQKICRDLGVSEIKKK